MQSAMKLRILLDFQNLQEINLIFEMASIDLLEVRFYTFKLL